MGAEGLLKAVSFKKATESMSKKSRECQMGVSSRQRGLQH